MMGTLGNGFAYLLLGLALALGVVLLAALAALVFGFVFGAVRIALDDYRAERAAERNRVDLSGEGAPDGWPSS